MPESPELLVTLPEAYQVTEAQVAAAFLTAGLLPVGNAADIASVVSTQIATTRRAFSATPFAAEPATFLATLIEESR